MGNSFYVSWENLIQNLNNKNISDKINNTLGPCPSPSSLQARCRDDKNLHKIFDWLERIGAEGAEGPLLLYGHSSHLLCHVREMSLSEGGMLWLLWRLTVFIFTFHMIPICCRPTGVWATWGCSWPPAASCHTSTGSPAARGAAVTCPPSISYVALPAGHSHC